MPTTIVLTARELATVLASLRGMQNVQQHEPLAPEITDIATNCGEFDALDHDEVDALCERINSTGIAPPPDAVSSTLRFPLATLDRVYRYLQTIADSAGHFSGGYNWHELDRLCGSPYSERAFTDLLALGWMTSRVIPNTYGHTAYQLIRPEAAT